jgi:hypothetical protein
MTSETENQMLQRCCAIPAPHQASQFCLEPSEPSEASEASEPSKQSVEV